LIAGALVNLDLATLHRLIAKCGGGVPRPRDSEPNAWPRVQATIICEPARGPGSSGGVAQGIQQRANSQFVGLSDASRVCARGARRSSALWAAVGIRPPSAHRASRRPQDSHSRWTRSGDKPACGKRSFLRRGGSRAGRSKRPWGFPGYGTAGGRPWRSERRPILSVG